MPITSSIQTQLEPGSIMVIMKPGMMTITPDELLYFFFFSCSIGVLITILFSMLSILYLKKRLSIIETRERT